MSEEEKKAIEELEKVRWNSLAIVVKNEDGKMDISYFTEKHKKTILNLIERLEKELDNIKEIEKSHQEENGKLREELEQEKEINKEIAIKNHKIKEESNAYEEEIIRLNNELEQYKMLDANIEKANKIIESNELIEEEIEIIESYRKLVEETGKKDWIVCNPNILWCDYFVRKDKIQEKIKWLEKEQKEYEGSQEREIQDDYVAKIMILEELLEEE